MSEGNLCVNVKFGVRVKTEPGEVVCVAGNADFLGGWQHSAAPVLYKARDETSFWTRTFTVGEGPAIAYRYFVALIHPPEESGDPSEVVILRWECHSQPRIFNTQCFYVEPTSFYVQDDFGTYEGQTKVDCGWLTCQTEIRVSLMGKPIRWYTPKYQRCRCRVKCVPIDLRPEDVQANVVEENGNGTSHDLIQFLMSSHTQVALLNETGCKPAPQPKYGVYPQDDTHLIYYTRNLEPEYTGFQFQFYPDEAGSCEDPENIGNAYLLPVPVRASSGQKTVPIIGGNFKPIGEIAVEWLMIKPMACNPCNMKGHAVPYEQLAGTPRALLLQDVNSTCDAASAQQIADVKENTLASLCEAAAKGADYVEFDVQLSKDKIPVLYHDFTVCLSMRKKGAVDMDWFEIGVHQLNYSQMQLFEVDQVNVKESFVKPTVASSEASDQQPFPSLRNVCEHIDPNVGFNIEVKYPQALKSTGQLEEGLTHYVDKNVYVDCVLQEILRSSLNERRVILSCFDPQVCSMMRIKQNRFPVMFLTQGSTARYPLYMDARTNCIETAVYFCQSEGLLGLSANVDDLAKCPSLIAMAQERGLIVYCWGEGASDTQSAHRLKKFQASPVTSHRLQERTWEERSRPLEEGKDDDLRVLHRSRSNSSESINSAMTNLDFPQHNRNMPRPPCKTSSLGNLAPYRNN